MRESRALELAAFLKRNALYVVFFVVAFNVGAIILNSNLKNSYRSDVGFTIYAVPKRVNLLCGSDKPCWHREFYGEVKDKVSSAVLVNGDSPRISLVSDNLESLDYLPGVVTKVAAAYTTRVYQEAQADMNAYTNDFPQQLLGTDPVASKYLMTRSIMELFSDGQLLAVHVLQPVVSSRSKNLGVWISVGTIMGALLGSVVALGVRRLRLLGARELV